MMLVKTKIRKSKIDGIGLCADEDIPKGKKVWKFNNIIDKYISKSDFKKLSPQSRKQIFNYVPLDKIRKKYLLCGDDGRFFNYSDHPNCDDSLDGITTALKNIKKGEELTVDYYSFYEDVGEHLNIKGVRKHKHNKN